MKIGFVGLGRMGSAMARNLLRAGHELVVFNRTASKADELKAEGARVADSPAAAAKKSEAVFTMMSDDTAVRAVVFGENGVASGLAKGAIHISSSTISVAFAREMAAEHARLGQTYLSAPVFGRPEAADAKKLIVVPAGPSDAVERCRPMFEAIGRQTSVAGTEGWQANAVKLCGNFMIASMVEAFGESYATLRKAGVNPQLFLEVMNGLFASPMYANYGKMIADERYEPAGFALKLGLKDARLVLEVAQEFASPMPLASLNRDHFLSAMANGQEEMDWASVARVAARNAGL